MVSQNLSTTDLPSSAAATERGIISREATVTAMAVAPGSMLMRYSAPFWSAVIAGALLVLSVFTLSWYLMLGCHVGIDESGIVALGGGSAVWIWVTSCIAFFCGGALAGDLSTRARNWYTGAAVWSLSIPLGLLIYAIAAHSGELLFSLYLPRTHYIGIATAHFGFFWAAFITLACGLVFSLIGSASGCACQKEPGA